MDPGSVYLPAAGDGSSPTRNGDPNAPRILVQQRAVTADAGGLATLRVRVSGRPTPDVYWRFGRRSIVSGEGKYKVLEDGTLQIVGVSAEEDEGVYTCLADNGHPRGAVQTSVTLTVRNAGRDIPVGILESDSQVFLSLGAPAVLHCLAYGHPKPTVTW